MPSTINATLTNGVAIQGDNSGSLALQTNNGTTAVTINTSQGVQCLNSISVGNATPTTSGAGITFPATQSASTDANTLDDYEEGIFTPSVVGQTTAGTFTYTYREGKYTKVGNLVSIQICLYISATSVSPVGQINITGLPFTISGTNLTFNSFSIGWVGNITFTGFLSSYGATGTSQLLLRRCTTASFGDTVAGSDLASSFYIFISGNYQV